MKTAVLVRDNGREWNTLYIDNIRVDEGRDVGNDKVTISIEHHVDQWIETSFAEDHPTLFTKYYYDPHMIDGEPGWLELPNSFLDGEWHELIA